MDITRIVRVGYGYYPNPTRFKKKNAGRMVTYCSIGFGFSISKLCTNYSCTGMNILWLIVVLYFPLFFFFLIYLLSGMLLWYVIIFQQNSWIPFSIIWKFGCHIVWESSYGLLYLQLLTLKKKKKKETESFEKLKLLYLMFWTWGWHVSFSLCLYVCIKC